MNLFQKYKVLTLLPKFKIKIRQPYYNNINNNNVRYHSTGLYKELESRQLIAQTSSSEISQQLDKESTTFYCGVDPTADSLHLGHLFVMLTLMRCVQYGHKTIALLGGATASIGDPSGKRSERPLLEKKTIKENQLKLKLQMEQLFQKLKQQLPKPIKKEDKIIDGEYLILNNNEWFEQFELIPFLNEVGKFVRVSNMLNKESVKQRLNTTGISYTEFSYQLLQAYDFYHLHHHFNCQIQIGGGDQWGNIVSGLDLISKKSKPINSKAIQPGLVFGLTTPLLTTSSGEKIGKSAGNAIWLDKEKTSPYQFYQYFMKVEDMDLLNFLLRFTFINVEECIQIVNEHMLKPELKYGQRRLANAMTQLIHGDEALKEAQLITKVLFNPERDLILQLDSNTLNKVFNEQPQLVFHLKYDEIIGKSLPELAVNSKLTKSKGEATRLIKSKGLYLNLQPILTFDYKIQESDLLANNWGLLLRAGKANYRVIKVL